MTKLSADIDMLNQAHKDLTTTRSELTQIKSRFEQYRNTVDSEWEGESAEAFKNKLDWYIRDLQCFINTIDELDSYTSTTVDYMKRLDEDSKNIASCFLSLDGKGGQI